MTISPSCGVFVAKRYSQRKMNSRGKTENIKLLLSSICFFVNIDISELTWVILVVSPTQEVEIANMVNVGSFLMLSLDWQPPSLFIFDHIEVMKFHASFYIVASGN